MNQYLCYGYLLPYDQSKEALEKLHTQAGAEEIFDKYYDSAYDKKIIEVEGFSIIQDGMCGEYIFFGKIFQKSSVHEPLSTTTMPKVTAKMKKQLVEQCIKVFGDTFEVKPETILLTHYR